MHITGDLISKRTIPVNQKMGGYDSSSSQITLHSHMLMFNQLQPAYHNTMRERQIQAQLCPILKYLGIGTM